MNALDQQKALRYAAQRLGQGVRMIIADLDATHGDGIAIPAIATEALATLGALAEAWHANGMGLPAPAHARAQLGLPEAGAAGTQPAQPAPLDGAAAPAVPPA